MNVPNVSSAFDSRMACACSMLKAMKHPVGTGLVYTGYGNVIRQFIHSHVYG